MAIVAVPSSAMIQLPSQSPKRPCSYAQAASQNLAPPISDPNPPVQTSILRDHLPHLAPIPKPFTPPPAVVTTPADRWPRPYYFSDGLRRVEPYHFTYNTNCKERWRGRSLLEVYTSEFRDRPESYYLSAILSGAIVVNGKPASEPSQLLSNGDLISHTLHRHEPPVTALPIGIISETNDMIVIDKPAGVPVHPAGRYNYNSIVEIMRADRGLTWNPLPCNRLDRLTSGVMFIGKHARAAERISDQIRGRRVRKEYVARVNGRFPDGDAICEQPILQISPKLGLNRVRATGKPARTVFRRLAWYPPGSSSSTSTGYSTVLCLPLTGRTHQIRVHLQYLGYPIANDPIYSNQRVFGVELGRGDTDGVDDESVMERLGRMGKEEVSEAVAWHDEMVEEYQRGKREKMNGKTCEICHTELYSDPAKEELGLWLHALRYSCPGEGSDHKGSEPNAKKGDGGLVADGEGAGGELGGAWAYESQLPEWAKPPLGQEALCGDVGAVVNVLEKVAERLESANVVS